MSANAATAQAFGEVSLLGFRLPTYRLAMHAGGVLAAAVVLPLGASAGLPPWTVAALLLMAYPLIIVVTRVRLVLTGRERLTLYHHAVLYMLLAASMVWLTGQPVLPYLDLLAVAFGCVLAVGRFGCLANGCCHGRPGRYGLRYGPAHVRAGLPAHLLGVRLVPVPLLESIGVGAAALVAATQVHGGAPNGTAFGTIVVAYACLRFLLEHYRGDPHRPYLIGLSEAQWTSLALVGFAWTAGLLGWVPSATWHHLVALTLALAAVVTVRRHRGRGNDLLGARHVDEMGRALIRGPGRTTHTSLGLLLTGTSVEEPAGRSEVYSFSRPGPGLRDKERRGVARALAALGRADTFTLVRGGGDVMHVVARDAGRPAGGSHAV